MANIVILGTQWGDEGKGKIVDLLTAEADLVVRYQGGANAGHTVVIGGQQYILHLVPSGILHPGKACMIGNGVVIDPVALIEEMEGVTSKGIDIEGRLYISKNAHVIMPYHKLLDGASEARRGGRKIGTTGRGIGPCYSDKMARTGIRMYDIANPDRLREALDKNVEHVNRLIADIYDGEPMDVEAVFDEYSRCGERLRPHLADVSLMVADARKSGKAVLIEGAQGTMLDIDHGTYPFVTSSNPTAGGACTGIGMGPTSIDGVLGIVKAYTTRVGRGPFPTELLDDVGAHIQQKGAEFGATTGRTRRCGWCDTVILRYSARVNGLTGLCLTKLDVLDELDTLYICNGYKYKGEVISEMPTEPDVFAECEPIYEEVPGWKSNIKGVTNYADLPEVARNYIARIEELVGVPFAMISTGPDRDETIIKHNPFSWKREVI